MFAGATGPKPATWFKSSDAVFKSIFGAGQGSLAEFVGVPENVAALKPENLDFVQADAIPMVGLTSSAGALLSQTSSFTVGVTLGRIFSTSALPSLSRGAFRL